MSFARALITGSKAVGGVVTAFGLKAASTAVKNPKLALTTAKNIRNVFTGKVNKERELKKDVKSVFAITKNFFSEGFKSVPKEKKNIVADFRSPEEQKKDPFKDSVFNKTKEEKDADKKFNTADRIFKFNK